jgi:uncharacterized membrane protein YuzA (DUF378 family)
MKALHMIAWILLVIGGLNWGLVGIGGFADSDWNVVHLIFGSWPTLEWIIYILVGLSALWLAFEPKGSRMSVPAAAPSAM